MKLLSIAILPLVGLYFLGIPQDPAAPASAGAPQQTKPVSPKQVKPIRVMVDDKEINFGANGVRVLGGRTFVPFRPLFEAMGAEVDYDLVHKKVTATKDNNEVELTIAERIARKNGAEITMEAPPQIINKTTYVPLRFVAESLDADVEFDGPGNLITIHTKG